MQQMTTVPGATTFPLEPPQKNSVSELGVTFWGSPLFLVFLGHSHVRGAPTLNFGPISTKFGGTVRAIKKMTQKDHPENNWEPIIVSLVQFENDFNTLTKMLYWARMGGWISYLRPDQFLDHLTVMINQSSSAALLINKTGSANALPRYAFQKVKADNLEMPRRWWK